MSCEKEFRNTAVLNKSAGHLFVLCVVFLFAACEKVVGQRPIALDSYLDTPTGQYQFRALTAKKAKEIGIYRDHHLYLLAEAPDVKVLFSCSGKIRIGGRSEDKMPTMILEPMQYQHAGERKRATIYPNPQRSLNLRQPWFAARSDKPDNFRSIELAIINAEPSEEQHHFTIPFSVDGNHYAAHLSVLIEAFEMYVHKINVPGTP